jgi:hypothetical protein
MIADRDQVADLVSVAVERMSNARWTIVRALLEARRTGGAGWQDESVQAARAEFIRAGAAHAAARQLLRDIDATGGAS